MKYIDADRLKAEINKRQKSLRAGIFGEVFTRKQKNEMLVASEELDRFNRIIDSLQQEQPEVDLNENTMKKEFRMIDSACLLFNYDKLSREQLIARRFYQLGLKAK